MTKSRTTIKVSRRDIATAYAFILPFYLIFLVFTVVPILLSLFLGFTQFNMLQKPVFIGLDNYTRLFLEDQIFIKAIGNTLLLATITGPLGYLIAFMTAWFINELRPRMRAFVTLIFYAPSISGNMYLIWQLMFSGDSYGYINGLLLKLNVITEPIIWFKNEKYMIPLICVVALWGSLGTSFLSFIAGFQGVDKSYYEAAAVDGLKNRWQELWYVTLPMMKPQLLFSAVMSITGSFGIGGLISSLCGFPTVNYAAHTIMNHLEDYGGQRYEIGYASAISTVLCILMIVCNKLVQKMLSKVST